MEHKRYNADETNILIMTLNINGLNNPKSQKTEISRLY